MNLFCKLFLSLALAMTLCMANAQSAGAPEPISQTLQDYFYTAIKKWNAGQSSISNFPNINTSMSQAMSSSEFSSVRTQLRQAGAKAWPLAPKVIEQLLQTTSNQYDLGWILTELTPSANPTSDFYFAAARVLNGNDPVERINTIAKLGKTSQADSVPLLVKAAAFGDARERVVALIALGYSGKQSPSSAVKALGRALTDSEKFNRQAALNALRLLGGDAIEVLPEIGAYLRTRENIYMTSGVLKNFPTSALVPLRPEFESIIRDTKYTEFQKKDAIDILLRIELGN
jgi:hypothetical protein